MKQFINLQREAMSGMESSNLTGNTDNQTMNNTPEETLRSIHQHIENIGEERELTDVENSIRNEIELNGYHMADDHSPKVKIIENKCAHEFVGYKQCCYCGAFDGWQGKIIEPRTQSNVESFRQAFFKWYSDAKDEAGQPPLSSQIYYWFERNLNIFELLCEKSRKQSTEENPAVNCNNRIQNTAVWIKVTNKTDLPTADKELLLEYDDVVRGLQTRRLIPSYVGWLMDQDNGNTNFRYLLEPESLTNNVNPSGLANEKYPDPKK